MSLPRFLNCHIRRPWVVFYLHFRRKFWTLWHNSCWTFIPIDDKNFRECTQRLIFEKKVLSYVFEIFQSFFSRFARVVHFLKLQSNHWTFWFFWYLPWWSILNLLWWVTLKEFAKFVEFFQQVRGFMAWPPLFLHSKPLHNNVQGVALTWKLLRHPMYFFGCDICFLIF